MTPTRRALAAIGAGVLLVAACGDDDEESSLFDDTGDEEPSSDENDEDEDDGGDDDDAPVAGADDFCDVVGELQGFDDMEDSFTDPEALESAISEFRALYEQSVELAPDEISSDIELVSDALGTFDDAFADADYNLLDVQVSVITDLEEPELEAATDRLDEYGESECGVEPDDDDDDEDNSFDEVVADLPEGATVRDGIVQQFINQGIEEEAAQCIGDELEPADFEDETNERITRHFETCGIDPTTGQPTD